MSTRRRIPDYRCPSCEEFADMVVGAEQAFCGNTQCLVATFNPSLLYDLNDFAEASFLDLSGLSAALPTAEGQTHDQGPR